MPARREVPVKRKSRKQPDPRVTEGETAAERRLLRFPHLLGGNAKFRSLPAEKRLRHLRGDERSKARDRSRFLSFEPGTPVRRKPFNVQIHLDAARLRKIAFVRLEVRFPSGNIEKIDYIPTSASRDQGHCSIGPFQSDAAGDLYVSARVYLSDGGVVNDARLCVLLSENPDQLVISPRAWLVSGRAGRVEYDWDTDEFHCRAYGVITNGSSVARTFRRCDVRVTDGGVGGTLISQFSFAVGPLTVNAGQSAYRTIDTWYPKGSEVWKKFNQRWDLTLEFTYVADGGVSVSDSAAYIPMSTVPINAIQTTDFSASQAAAEGNAVAIAAEILEQRDITLYGPYWRIISSQQDKDRFGTIDIGWSNNWWDFGEAGDMYEAISGPEGDRLDVFIPTAFSYKPEVPADKRNVGGFSTLNGPFPKDDDGRRSGSLVLLDENDQEFFGIAIAHEICHYLGLDHVEDANNLMQANGGNAPHELTWEQWDTIRQHGMMKWLAPDI
jgi:hypothetical protein